MKRERTQNEVSEARKIRGDGLEVVRTGPEPVGPLPAQVRLLLSLQSSSGNRAVAGLVQRRQKEAGDGGLGRRPSPGQHGGVEEERPLQARSTLVQHEHREDAKLQTREAKSPVAQLQPVVQRYVVPQATIPGMAGPLDTTQLDGAKGLIDQLFNSGRRDSLITLYSEIGQHDAQNKTLKDHITKYVQGTPGDAPMNQTSGLGERIALHAKYMFADTSDQGVQAGLRMWVSGDPTRGIGWKMICRHLRGQLGQPDYVQVGTLHYLIEDQNNHTNDEPTFSDLQKEQAARLILDNAAQAINGALAALPAHDNVSYRQSGVASATTYGTTIRVGDVIRDKAFWSTSALRISGSAGGWGTNGTLAAPKVYFLITGSTGKYISKHAAQEEGQHEVLFSNNICFRVDRIANYGNHTLFVGITEVPAVGLNMAKNPYDGTAA